ncbi:nucleotidyl transferase AbiEii/AbiGii toxin family protein [Candidatus Uhrbacteria bacterium]|nr:nucleotidyl transferase AbiEii/AbiGii toxin family protein [Candidatus Uhrbacteria bacterium]
MPKILTKEQIAVLKAVGKNKELASRFYLSGGTPLAEFYLHHRYSEDLDFFSEQEVDAAGIYTFFMKEKDHMEIKKIDAQSSFNRNLFFLHGAFGVLKTEFTYYPFPRIEAGMKKYGVSIDSALDIATNKLFTIYQRTKARDYIDLYCLCKKYGFSIKDLLSKARLKFDWHVDPLQLGAQFLRVKDAEDVPRMIKKFPQMDVEDFFLAEASRLKGGVLGP